MYKTVLTFKDGVTDDELAALRKSCEDAYDNRAGKVACKTDIDLPNRIFFEGGESLYCCLQLGNSILCKTKGFLDCVSSWEWIDNDDPNENHSVIEAYAEFLLMKAKAS